jgi:excisionase family DNA binding protein
VATTVESSGAFPASQIASGEDTLITIAEAAALMRVSPMTVYRLVHARELAAIRVGRSFRICRGDLDAFLRTCQHPTPDAVPARPAPASPQAQPPESSR